MVLVFVLGESTKSVLRTLLGASACDGSEAYGPWVGYLRHQIADSLCQEDLWGVRYSMARSSFLNMFLFVFQL